eukprot:3075006-Pyramimonas_sp.AAC.1
MRAASAPRIISVFAVLILSAAVTSLGSRCARRFALSCADCTTPLPYMSLRNLFHVPVRSVRR